MSRMPGGDGTSRQRGNAHLSRRPGQRARKTGRDHFWSRRRSPQRQEAPEPGRARDLFVELELTTDEASRGMVVPIEVPWSGRTRTFEIVVPRDASDGATASTWLEEGRSRLHVILRIV